MKKPKALVLSGYGLNCEEETAYAFESAGASTDIVHINDLIERPRKLKTYQIAVIPGGFSYGDDTGSGRAYANKLKNNLWPELQDFISDDKLLAGICNGFQVVANLGILSGSLVHNRSARYSDRWVDLKVESNSPWLSNLDNFSCPIAHGEGNYFVTQQELKRLKQQGMVALRYVKGEICRWQDLQSNPNGSVDNIAGVTDTTGRVLGMMPHPERAMFFTQLPNWTLLKEEYKRSGRKLPQFGPGLQIFKNAVKYFQ